MSSRLVVKIWIGDTDSALVYLCAEVRDGKRLFWVQDGEFGRKYGWIVDTDLVRRLATEYFNRRFDVRAVTEPCSGGTTWLRQLVFVEHDIATPYDVVTSRIG